MSLMEEQLERPRAHLRSVENRAKRNRTKKMKRKLKRMKSLEFERVSKASTEAEVLKLKRENFLLEKTLHSCKNRIPPNRRFSSHYTSFNKMLKNKTDSVLEKLSKLSLSSFDARQLIEYEEIGQGVFGTVRKGFVVDMKLEVAVKSFSESYGQKMIKAEALICHKVSGHPNFPFFYGLLHNSALIMEYIKNSTTLRNFLNLKCSRLGLTKLCEGVVRGIHHIHMFGLLHNDIHCGNVLVINNDYSVKIIDFGKCSTVDDPIVYSIKPGSEKQKKYNKCHRHLAFELRNISGSKVSFKTDIYSIGYVFSKVSEAFENDNLRKISTLMLDNNPEKRPDLSDVLFKLSFI